MNDQFTFQVCAAVRMGLGLVLLLLRRGFSSKWSAASRVESEGGLAGS